MAIQKPVTLDGVTYPSGADAARALGVSKQAISQRVANQVPKPPIEPRPKKEPVPKPTRALRTEAVGSGSQHFTAYISDRVGFVSKLDEIASHRGLMAKVGRYAGATNRSAVVVALVDEEMARVAAEKARGSR